MNQKLKLTITLLSAIFLLSACVVRERDGGTIQMFGYGYDDDISEVVSLQNDFLRLDFLTETAEIIVTELATGTEWRSTPYGTVDNEDATAIEFFRKQSLFLLEFENSQGSNWIYDTYRFAVQTGHFEHAFLESENALELYFTIGDIPPTFQVPNAIYEERFNFFLDQMPRAEMMQVMNVYRPFHIDRLRAGDDRAALIAQFPTLEDGETIYVLQDNVQGFLLERIQDSLEAVGYTAEEWQADQEYFGLATGGDRPEFNLTMRFELDRNNMVVSIPFNSITYRTDFIPTRLTIMPYFGAARADEDGYIFVPDGSGALINFDSGRYNQALYWNNVFGWDEAIIRDALIHDNRAAFPVFGVYKNGATFAGIIDEGASYAAIRAEVAGMGSPYNRVHPTFRLIHGALLDVAGRADAQLLLHEWQLPQDEYITIRYTFTETPGYVGMAVAFREFLQERHPQLNDRVQAPMTAMVEILGSALTNQHFLGFPVERPFALTTFSQAGEMLETLADFGWQGVPVMMRGMHNDSIDHVIPTSLDMVSQLGSRAAMTNLLNTADRLGFDFFIEGDFVNMRGNRLFNGFSLNRDAARQANRRRVEHNGFSHIFFGENGSESVLADPTILATPEFTTRIIHNFVDEAAGHGINNIAFRSMAAQLAGDFNEDRHVTREKSMNMRQETLATLQNSGTGVWLNYGFSYAVPFADIITGMPVSDQAFGITSATVPFYQIALHGIVPFAGRPLNLAEDHSYHLLRSVEGGASLFFSFMHVPTAELNVTRYRRYFANEFDRWQHVADEVYQRHAESFSHLYNQLIVDHQLLNIDGVSLTVYEDGTQVFVNTSNHDFTTADGRQIPTMRYLVVRNINGAEVLTGTAIE
ncbi:MAG: DUF5696 domain-containing protein [Firmicutes bacterium]|nr:DUF5696 domain-containing protein [Bacillota bacterium]